MDAAATPPTTLLVVDDDPRLRASIVGALREQGYIVASAHDGLSALALLQGIAVDLILLDLRMPGMNGFEFLEAWTADVRSGAPVILVTANGHADLLPPGCAALLPKPFATAELFDVVRRFVGR